MNLSKIKKYKPLLKPILITAVLALVFAFTYKGLALAHEATVNWLNNYYYEQLKDKQERLHNEAEDLRRQIEEKSAEWHYAEAQKRTLIMETHEANKEVNPNQVVEDYILKYEFSKADESVKSIKYICEKPEVYCTNILGSYGGVLAKDHEKGGAIDLVFENADIAKEYKHNLANKGFACEFHYNYTGKIAYKYEKGKNHLHCTSADYINATLADIGEIYFTSFNPKVGQTDSTPCHAGGTQFDICEMARGGQRPIAFSQDLVSWTGRGILSAGMKVNLVSTDYPDDPRCNGEFIVSDSMNARFTHRGDLFFLSRKDNISCNANVYIIK